MKIKVKKDMFLAELIEWGFDNKVTGETFISNSDGKVTFLDDGWIETSKAIHPRSFFEVEVEEEIDEDTVIPKLIQVLEYNDNTDVILNENKSINTVFDESLDDLLYMPKTFYMLNDDYTMTLIWRNGGMVE